jgi:hypothetical protein
MTKEIATPKEDKMLYIIQMYEAQDDESIECMCDVSEDKIREESLTYSFETEKDRQEVMDEVDSGRLGNLHYRTTEVPLSEWRKYYYEKEV